MRMAPNALPGRRSGCRPGSGSAPSSRAAARVRGRRGRQPVVDASRRVRSRCLLGGHIDSVPNGGWLDGCLNVVAAVEVAEADRSGGHASRHRSPRQLGRRGRRSLRPVALRLLRGRRLDGRPGRSARAARPRRRRAPGCAARARRRSRQRPRRRARSWRDAAAYLELHIEQGPVLESMDLPLGAVLGTFGVERYRIIWRGQAAHAGSTPMDQRRDALAGAAKLALELREIARAGRRRRRAHERRRRLQAGDRHLGRRDRRAAPRHAPPRCGEARLDVGAGARGLRALCAGGAARGRVRADLGDRADPLRRDAHRLRGRGDPRGGGHVAQAAERAAARCRRGLARRRSDGDDLRPEPPRPLAHEARGHEARAHRAGGPGARPARGQDDRPGRVRLSAAPSPPAAVVFDCDGLLLETESCWSLAEAELFARYGKVFGDDEKRVLIGTSAYAGSRRARALLEQPGRAEPLGLELSELVERRLLEEATAFPEPRSSCRNSRDACRSQWRRTRRERLVRGALACAGLARVLRDRRHGRSGRRAEAVARRLSPSVRAARRRAVPLDRPRGLSDRRRRCPRRRHVRDRDPVVSGSPARRGGPRAVRRWTILASELRSASDAQRKRTAATPAATSAMPSRRPGVMGFSSNPTQPKWSTASDATACPARMKRRARLRRASAPSTTLPRT